MSQTENHFISVSRKGVLMARRKGGRPVAVAEGSVGIEVVPDAESVARGVPSLLRVRFRHGGSNREICVTDVVVGQDALDVAVFQQRFTVADGLLGSWIRNAVEAALNRAERGQQHR
jgi:hypothetical protein